MRPELNENQAVQCAYFQSIGSRAQRTLLAAAIFLPVAFLCGCSGVVTGQGGQSTPPPTTYSVSGTINPTVGGAGATLTLSGGASATTTANSTGAYSFAGLANGTYTITASHTGFTFNPTSRAVTINGASISAQDFTATAKPNQTFSISGTISPAAGGNGATLTLSGATSVTTTANSSGNYTFSGLANGMYAITPSRAGYTFSPTSQSAAVNGANVTGVNFTATAQVGPTFSISGTITPAPGGSGATVILSGAAGATTITNSAGSYTFAGLAKGSYSVTPNHSGFAFNPTNQGVTINAANLTGVNFTATAQVSHTVALTWNASTSTVSGYNVYRTTVSGSSYVRINPSLDSSLAYTDATVQNGTTYFYVTTAVDASGNESAFSNEVPAVIP